MIRSFQRRLGQERLWQRFRAAETTRRIRRLARRLATGGEGVRWVRRLPDLLSPLTPRSLSRGRLLLEALAEAQDPLDLLEGIEEPIRDPHRPFEIRLALTYLLHVGLGLDGAEPFFSLILAGMTPGHLLAFLDRVLTGPEGWEGLLELLDPQPVAFLRAFLGALPAERPYTLPFLQAFVLDESPEVRRVALDRLARHPDPEAGRALRQLAPFLGGEEQDWLERSLRRRRLAGLPTPDLPAYPGPSRVRAWLSAYQEGSLRTLLLCRREGGRWRGVLYLLDHEPPSLLQVERLTSGALPPFEGFGRTMEGVPGGGGFWGEGEPERLVEVPFAEGVRALTRLLRLARPYQGAWPTAFRLWGLWPWAYGGPVPPLPVVLDGEEAEGLTGEALLDHPACVGWLLQDERVFRAARKLPEPPPGPAGEALLRTFAHRFAPLYLEGPEREWLALRLDETGRWLAWQGEGAAARGVWREAAAVWARRPTPFLVGLLARSLRAARALTVSG